MDLSQKRADAVVNALIKKGVPNKMLKAKGVGMRVYMARTFLWNMQNGYIPRYRNICRFDRGEIFYGI